MIEEFIEGREFTVLVAENPENEWNPIVFQPVECIFKEGESFKHFNLKWLDFGKIEWVGVQDKDL